MKKFNLNICYFLWVGVMILAISVANAEVKVATTANFTDVLNLTEVVMVKFYAPWCGHCKALKPEYEEASELVGSVATLAEVDCTQEHDLAEKYGITGYPTIITFRKGEMVEKYGGPRKAQEIANYLKLQSKEAVQVVTSMDELEKLKADEYIPLCVIKSASATTPFAKMMYEIADTKRGTYAFALVTDESINVADAPMETLTVFRGKDEQEMYEGNVLDKEAVNSFLAIAQIPYIGEINQQTYKKYMTDKPVGWLFLSKDNGEDLKKSLIEVARKVRKDVFFCWINADIYSAVGQQMALPANVTYPAFVIDSNKRHYIHPLNDTITAESVQQFIEKYLKGEVKSTIMSEPIPEVEVEEGLTTLVGHSLPKYLNGTKDLVIFFFAPWCQHCKKFEPEYAKLAKEMDDAEIVIGKLDVTKNDFDHDKFTVEGIPTLYFVPVDNKPILFQGNRTYEDLKEFVIAHMTVPYSGANKTTQPPKEQDNHTVDKEDL